MAKLNARTPLGATDLDAGLRTAAKSFASDGAARTVGFLGIERSEGIRRIVFRGADYTFANALIGGGVFDKAFSGVATLTGDNSSFTGEFRVSGGTIRSGAANALGTGAAVANVTGTLDLNLHNATFAGLSGAGTVTNTGVGGAQLTTVVRAAHVA